MTGGGIFPAIYGTVLLTMLMTIAGVPVGIATAIYLAEYAPPRSRMARLVRARRAEPRGRALDRVRPLRPRLLRAVHRLAMDDALYGPTTPVWGKPAILWASLTLAVLTLPVVIVDHRRGAPQVPRELRDASLALGATRSRPSTRSSCRTRAAASSPASSSP
jgi:phosphate transport system permease protein